MRMVAIRLAIALALLACAGLAWAEEDNGKQRPVKSINIDLEGQMNINAISVVYRYLNVPGVIQAYVASLANYGGHAVVRRAETKVVKPNHVLVKAYIYGHMGDFYKARIVIDVYYQE